MLKPLWAFGDTLENLDFRLETPAVNVIVEDGVVKGVYAQSGDDIIRINAKATVLATGGFGKNPESVPNVFASPVSVLYFWDSMARMATVSTWPWRREPLRRHLPRLWYGLFRRLAAKAGAVCLNLHPMAPFIPLSA